MNTVIASKYVRVSSLRELKDAIKVGTRIEAIEHWRPEVLGGIRTVTKTQTNGYWFLLPGAERRSWADYPKRSELAFNDDGSITFYPANQPTGKHWWRIGILKDAS